MCGARKKPLLAADLPPVIRWLCLLPAASPYRCHSVAARASDLRPPPARQARKKKEAKIQKEAAAARLKAEMAKEREAAAKAAASAAAKAARVGGAAGLAAAACRDEAAEGAAEALRAKVAKAAARAAHAGSAAGAAAATASVKTAKYAKYAKQARKTLDELAAADRARAEAERKRAEQMAELAEAERVQAESKLDRAQKEALVRELEATVAEEERQLQAALQEVAAASSASDGLTPDLRELVQAGMITVDQARAVHSATQYECGVAGRVAGRTQRSLRNFGTPPLLDTYSAESNKNKHPPVLATTRLSCRRGR